MTFGGKAGWFSNAAKARDRDVQNANELHNSLQETAAAGTGAALMSKTTLQQYRPYQQSFEDWCTRKEYADGRLVREDKLLLWLKEEVVYGPKKESKGKQKASKKSDAGQEESQTPDDGICAAPIAAGHAGHHRRGNLPNVAREAIRPAIRRARHSGGYTYWYTIVSDGESIINRTHLE